MKNIVISLLAVMCVVVLIPCAAEASFDFSLFSNKSSPYCSIFDEVSYEDRYAFITPSLTYDEMEFTHPEESSYYYSTINPDILVIDYGKSDERVAFRLLITYCTELPALNPHKASILIGNNKYNFDIAENTKSYVSGSSTNTDSICIVLNSDSIGMMKEWCNAVDDNESINITLTGASNSIEFEVPDTVATISALSYNAYVSSGGLESINEISGTPVEVSSTSSNCFDTILNDKDKLNGQTIYMDLAKAAMSFPAEYLVFGRNMDPASPVLSKLGLSSAEVNSMLEDLELEYDIFSEDGSIEFGVSITDAYGLRFDNLDSNAAKQLNEDMSSLLVSVGNSVKETGFFDTPYSRVWRAYTLITATDNTKTYSLQYYTINNDKILVLYAYSYGDDFSSFEKELCDSIATTIRFGNEMVDCNTMLSTERYRDTSNGLSASFSIPSLWYTDSVSAKQKGQFSVKVKPYGGSGVILAYGFWDFYQRMVDAGKPPKSREDVFDKEEFNISDDEIQAVLNELDMSEDAFIDYRSIGNREYICAFKRQPVEYGGATVNNSSLYLFYCDTNTGIAHLFAFIADEEDFDTYVDDVIGIIESANYPSQT